MKALITLLTLVTMTVAAGCETRTRENPFDPLNPETGGRPSLLNAAARDGVVDLRWEDGSMMGIKAFGIYKGTSPDSLTRVVSIPFQYRLFREGGLTNGATYYFAIGFEFYEGEDLLTAAEPVTPGPDVPWVLDGGDPPLALLGADGRSVVSREASGADLADISIEPEISFVWCIDPVEGRLMAYDKNGRLSASRPGFELYYRVSADLASGGVWTISFDRGTLERVDERGVRSMIDSTLVMPLDVDASPLGGCWVSDAQGLVHRYAPDGSKQTVEQVARPTRLSATGENSVWVADPLWDEALKISTAGIVARVSGLDGPFDVAATPDGGCWIADRTRVLRVDSSGEIQATAGGFTGAGSIDYNPRTDECWVADSLADRVVRLSSEGERLTVLSDLTSPFVIAGRWGRPD
jgi:sugar lactone lactonase YvrE